jgi:tetratricopeptide (TPR) repeat protein
MRLESLVRDALRAQESGNFEAAAAIAEQADREGLAHPILLRMRSASCAMSGRFPEAGALLNRALALDPRDPLTIADIGRVLVAEDRAEESIAAFRAALSIRSDLVDVWLELGSAHEMLKQEDAAASAFQQAHTLAPEAPGPLAALAMVARRRNDSVACRAFASRAVALQPDHVAANFALAGLDLGARKYEDVMTRVQAMMATGTLDELQSASAFATLAEALEGLGRYPEAFDMYAKWNEATRRTHAPKFGEGGRIENHMHYMSRMKSWFERQDPADWREPWPAGDYVSPVKRHIFLFGYPRSGTTLLENILASFAEVRGLEEQPTLAVADWEFLRDDQAMDRLTRLDPVLAAEQRNEYWQRVRREVPDVDGKVFVDMGPLYGIKLQVIARLFPDALLVRCKRDPRDVVLSCFKMAFRVNASTYQMTTLEGAARHFDLAMQLTELHLSVLPLPVHVVDYATLVSDFDASTGALAEFIGIPWTEDVRAFDRTARGRQLRTASAQQVRRGLYDGTRQWLRYRDHLAPVLPILEPWVTRFGYPLSLEDDSVS